MGSVPVNLGFAGRYFLQKPTAGPDWSLRLEATFVLLTAWEQ
jgi:hypothetical protein